MSNRSNTDSEKNKLLEMDLYKLLEITEESTIEQIKKAYRKRALELHPDKNLDNKEEAEKKFIQLGKAFEILSDKSARSAYDAVRKSKREKAKRDEQLDEKRRKLKESLEERERTAKEKFQQQTDTIRKSKEEERLQHEIERLRKEGSKLLEEEMNFIKEQIRIEKKRAASSSSSNNNNNNKATSLNEDIKQAPRIKINWSTKSSSSSSSSTSSSSPSSSVKLDEDLLKNIFSKYGHLEALVVSKKSSAILEYKTNEEAIKCLNDQANLNRLYTISLKWLGQDLEATRKQNDEISQKEELNKFDLNNFDDMETAILKRLKHAASSSKPTNE